MKIYAINGGPRKGWNTDTMLDSFLEGAKSAHPDVETEKVYLYDLNYKGCTSCFGCQRDDGRTYGQCQVKDDIHQLLRDVPLAGGVVFGCPIYLHDQTAELRAFIERFVYQFMNFEAEGPNSNAPKMLRTATIYTMNVSEDAMRRANYDHILGASEMFLQSAFGYKPVRICAHNTYQFKDYTQYRAGYWDERKKGEHRESRFPLDCKAAYDAGRQMAQDIFSDGI